MPQVPSYGPRKVDTRPLPGVERGPAPSPDVYGAHFGAIVADIGTRGVDQLAPGAARQAGPGRRARGEQPTRRVARQAASITRRPGCCKRGRGKTPSVCRTRSPTNTNRSRARLRGHCRPIGSGSPSPGSRRRRGDQVQMATYQHVDREMTQYADTQAKAGVALAASEAIQQAGNPLLVNRSLADRRRHHSGPAEGPVARSRPGRDPGLHDRGAHGHPRQAAHRESGPGRAGLLRPDEAADQRGGAGED